MKYIPINCKTHFSLLKAFSKPNRLAEKCAEYGYESCGIADIKTLAGAVKFHNSCKKKGIKPIIGCEYDGYILYAKNKQGWFDLMKYTTVYNISPDIKQLKDIANNGNVLCVSPTASFKNLFGKNFVEYDYKKRAVYYASKEEASLHRVLLCSDMKTTLPKITAKLKKEEQVDNQIFFTCDNFYIPENLVCDQTELKAIEKINDSCEEYEIAERPKLPKFDCPNGYTEDEYLKELCRRGWKKLLIPSGKIDDEKSKQIYLERIKKEMDIIFKAGLSGYFLIVQDIINFVRSRGWLPGPGRGSAGGSLVSYLTEIITVDPIEYGLIFERFYSEGRNTGDHISLPDIDMDVPSEHRDEVIDYIKQKYGYNRVSQMATFGRLQGRSAAKEILRINEAVSFSEMNEITESIPDEALISDQLELMDEEDRSIIKWTLINNPKDLEKWCKLNNNGELEGPLANIFDQAIKLEGTNKSQGRHAAGVIISSENLQDCCLMIKDSEDKMIAGFEMGDLETLGHVKFDVLGISLLSKIMDICKQD